MFERVNGKRGESVVNSIEPVFFVGKIQEGDYLNDISFFISSPL